MSIDSWRLTLEILEFLLTGAIGVYVYLSSRDTVTNDRIGKLEEDIDKKFGNQGERIAHLESRSETSPTHDDLGDLHERITDVKGGMDTLTGELSGIKTTLNLIHQHLLSGGRK